MTLFIVLLILALIVFGVGFAVHLLWWLLIILLVIAVLSWLFGAAALEEAPRFGNCCLRRRYLLVT